MLNPQSQTTKGQKNPGQKLFYNQAFLQPPDCNSSTFLREISYKVNLTDLYKVVSSCYYNAQMDYCPILLQITNKIIQKEYNCDYLLQVWNKEGKLVFQRKLLNKISVWGISNDVFIYKPQIGDDNSDCYHVTDLKNGNATLLIKDPINDLSYNHLAYSNDGILFIANKSTVHLLPCQPSTLQSGEQKRVDIRDKDIQKIQPGLPIHGLITYRQSYGQFFWKNLVIIAMETEDNQIDFSQITPLNMGTDDFTYELKQQRELVQRDISIDPITKFSYIVDEHNCFYGIAVKDSGLFDVYWNMTLVDSPIGCSAHDIQCSFDSLYLKMANGDIRGISTKNGPSVNFEQSVKENDEFEFPIIFYQNIKNHVNLYNSFTLIRTTLYIVHGQFVSLYNIQENQWIKHCKFQEAAIQCLFEKAGTTESKDQHDVAILLENGAIYTSISKVFFAPREDDSTAPQLVMIDPSLRSHQVPGKLIRVAQDNQRHEWFYLLTKDQTKFRLYTLHYEKLLEIHFDKDLDEFTDFVHVFCPSEEQYFVVQKLHDVKLYKISFGKPELTPEELESQMFQLVEDVVKLDLIFSEQFEIQGNLHSCISLDIKDHIFLIDQFHFYRYYRLTKVKKTYYNQNCVGLYVIDDKFCYSLSHSSEKRTSGLLLYDINNIIKKDNDVSYKLSGVQVGFSGYLDWNTDYSRFTLLKSLDTLIIIPALHRNTIAFIGMSKREHYLATKVIKDKFIALDKNNFLFCWNIVTGKLLSASKLPARQDYSNFTIFRSGLDTEETCAYNRNWYQKILLVKTDPEPEFDESAFYKEEGHSSQTLKNQVPFSQTQKRDFKEFRLIEIISENEVKEHLVFIHPFYHTEKQRLYFDTNNFYMIEKLSHPRVFIYEREESKMRRHVKWHCMKRFAKFPEDLENNSGFLRTVSPSFQNFVMIDRALNQFVIRDTFSLGERCKIPFNLMNPQEESASEIMNRFKWVDEDRIKVINKEGIEVIIDINDKFKEIEYSVIPLFDMEELKDPLRGVYTNRKPLQVSQVKDRLIRKYQAYKQAYYLDHKTEPNLIYEDLYTVDYQINYCRGMYIADSSFTFLHWQIIEQLQKKNLKIESIDDSQIELLCYNILPGGNTVLHQLNTHGDAIKKIFMLAHPNEEDIHEKRFQIPVLQNLQGKSALHLCKDNFDIRTIDTMMTYLAGYGIDHHSRAIVDLIPFCLEKQMPSLMNYLDTRMYQTERLTKVNKGCLKVGPEETGINDMSLSFGQEELEKKFFKQRVPGDDTLIDRPIRMEFLDIPRIYHYSDEQFNYLFKQLSTTDMLEIFEQKSIQKLVEFNYPLVKHWTKKKLLRPFTFFQIHLFVYLNFVFGHDSAIANLLDFPMQVVLGLYSLYFLHNEYLQMFHEGWNYLNSVWNYIDIITPSTILSVLTINTLSINIGEEAERMLQAIGVFFMWYKFLYFFRLSKSYGYLTRLIITVMMDMSTFLVVLFFTIIAFSDTFLTISNGNKGDGETEPFVHGFFDSIIYTYLIILGSFDLAHFQNSIATQLLIAFFILCTVFNTIVMLNLLIAIISETFSIVKASAENTSFQEMAALISENSYLIPKDVKNAYASNSRYLMVVTDLEKELEGSKDEVLSRLELIKKNVLGKIEKIQKSLKTIKSQNKQQEKQGEIQGKDLQRVIWMVSNVPGVPQILDSQVPRIDVDAITRSMMANKPLTQRQGAGGASTPGSNMSQSFAFAGKAEEIKRITGTK